MDCKELPLCGGQVVYLILRHFFLSCSWVSISSMIADQVESRLLSAAFWRSRRCWQHNAGASLANSNCHGCYVDNSIVVVAMAALNN